jgi:hypothetical protein
MDTLTISSNCNILDWCQKMLNDNTDPCSLPTSTTTTIRQIPTTIATSTSTTVTTTIPCQPESCNNLLELIKSRFGSVCDSPGYNPVADINKDKSINIMDMTTVSSNCGNDEWCKAMLSNNNYPCIVCGNYKCETSENCGNCPEDCGCPIKNVCRPGHELASKRGCVPMSTVDLCVYDCLNSNNKFLCRFRCGISCALGFCNIGPR